MRLTRQLVDSDGGESEQSGTRRIRRTTIRQVETEREGFDERFKYADPRFFDSTTALAGEDLKDGSDSASTIRQTPAIQPAFPLGASRVQLASPISHRQRTSPFNFGQPPPTS